ncbi:MAG: phage terminase large subunit [Oscillospiraceae bacterium]|nr:phage terminase large subunit [Bacillota bacterium]DAO97839.1 MAG TPA: Large subunit terminase [Caudoviricetes sp.]
MEKTVEIDLGRPNSEPQWAFFLSRAKYTCYGGARGGGKSWAVVRKTAGGAWQYPGIQILLVRREFDEMENTLIAPLLRLFPPGTASYNRTNRVLTLCNGSAVKFGNLPGYGASVEGKYQGQSYDWLFLDEATNFTEEEFRGLAACVRGVNRIPKRVYLTCNPGGVGHAWVKRLFLDRRFRPGEEPADYCFIPATVDDNRDLMEANPDYVKQLELLPEDKRRAHRYGDWDALAGAYFSEFDRSVHVCVPFLLPPGWARYRAFDYGLDMLACLWVAVEPGGRCYVYREWFESDLVVSQAARRMLDLTAPGESIVCTMAPPDLWSRVKESGKTMATLFAEAGLGLLRTGNNRQAGWMAVKELLRVGEGGTPGLQIFGSCPRLISDLQGLRHDPRNPNDAAREPHGVTHGPDALRYFAQTYLLPPGKEEEGEMEAYRRALWG